MRLGELACAALYAVAVAPIVILSIPIALPATILSVTISKRRFWRLRTGDVLGASYVVLHPPKRGSEFRVLCTKDPCTLHVWKGVDTAHDTLFETLPDGFIETVFNPMRRTKRLRAYEVAELLLAGESGRYRAIKHDENRHSCVYAGEQDLFWMRCRSFELLRPVRVIQRAWRAHAARRREAAARVITRAALHFLYRPKGWAYDAGSRSWHEACCTA
jgi:hypothetical protein